MDNGLLEASSTAWLVPFLLLDLRRSDAYGHELRRRMSDLSLHERRPGAVYRPLRQIEGEGMVFCDRDEDGYETSERRYSITEAGEPYLEFWAESLVRYREEIELFSEVYERTRRGVYK